MSEAQWSSDLISPKNVAGTALIGKACDIIEIIGSAPGFVGQAVLAERTGIPRATLYRILAALISRGLVRADPLTQNYTLGFNFLEFAQNAWSSSDLASIASVELRRLRDLTGETSYLAVQEGNHVLALGRFESAHDRRSNAKLGALKPMHCTSQGKAILSHLSEAQLAHVLSGELSSFTDKTITDPAQLRAHLSIVRARGYAVDDEEIVLGTRCVGAAILDPDGKPLAAISVAGPTFRMNLERAEQLGKELAEAAKRISAQLAPTLKAAAQISTDFHIWSTASAFAGASPRWDGRSGTMYWADQLAPSIRIAGSSDDFISLHALSQSVSSFILTETGFICAAGGDFVVGDSEGLHERIVGRYNQSVKALRAAPDSRVWAAVFDPEANVSRIGPVSRESGVEQVFELPGEVNDIAFAGALGIFVAQSSRQSIYLLEPITGRRRKFADLPKVAGAPVALAIDANLNPWIGLADGWSVVKLNENGEIERTIALPVPSPTGIAFGGEGLSQIFITSARSGLSRESLTNAPLSGQLFSIDVGERGLPDHLGKI
ncbi:IclR family transcriptional regulator domain-containing protein [Brucella intermedia]|uniref:IclR family transcriptional regulator domain-containing protein n=1 Tax=Brucella intermedia TaxID=94625 RepID=UPI00178C2F76|nr:IclR family transcriptional regulator C-terminal domain-containing protein [Brucella intermedia]MCO7739162.1 SMP-30/gluconolactonase/LRE family protein [Brucella intermedia]